MAEPRRIYRTIARAAQQRPPSNAAFSAAEDRGTDSLNAPSVAGAAAAAADSRYDRSEPARPEPPAPAGKPVSTAARFRDGDAPSPTSVGDDACIVPPASRNHRPTGKAAHQRASLEGKLAPQATEGCIATSPNQYPNGETAAPSAADKPAPPESVKAAQGAAPLRHRQKAATPPLAGEASGGTAKPKRGRKGKAKADDTPPTPAEIIKAKRRRCADAEDIAGFLTKLVAIVVLLALAVRVRVRRDADGKRRHVAAHLGGGPAALLPPGR